MGIAFIIFGQSITWQLMEVEYTVNRESEKVCSSPYSVTNYIIIDKPVTSISFCFLICKIWRMNCMIAKMPSNSKSSIIGRKKYRWYQEILVERHTSLKADEKYWKGGGTLYFIFTWLDFSELNHLMECITQSQKTYRSKQSSKNKRWTYVRKR